MPSSVMEGWDIYCKIALRSKSIDITDVKSTLVKLMGWCRQAATITWVNADRDLCRLMVS